MDVLARKEKALSFYRRYIEIFVCVWD